MKSSFGQIKALNSVRGLAALIVVFSHFAGLFYPATVHGSSQVIHTRFDVLIHETPLRFFFAGTFAVTIFFILSGFVLTLKYLSGRQKSLFSSAVKRYFRLMPVALVSVLFAYFLVASGLSVTLNGSKEVLAQHNFNPTFLDAFIQGTVGVFTMDSRGVKFYNPVLWTLYYELLGSMLVFGLATMSRGQPKRWLLYIIALLAFSTTSFVGFIVGLILADIYVTKPNWYEKVRDMSVWYKVGLLIIAFCIAGYPGHTPDSIGNYWRMFTIIQDEVVLDRSLLQLIAGTIIIVLTLSWGRLSRLLEARPLLWLGKISFTLYAVHLLFIYSFSIKFFSMFSHHFNYNISFLLTFGLSLFIIMIISEILHRYVEIPSIIVANKIGKWSEK